MGEELDRDALIKDILDLEQRCRDLEGVVGKSKQRQGAAIRWGRKALLYVFFGRSLTLSLGQLIAAVHEKRGPLLGREMAKTLDAAVDKLIGYKRWLVLFGSLAALPGMISMILLWQQNNVLNEEMDDVHADSEQWERGEYLSTIYSVRDKSDIGYTTTPIFSAASRTDAVLKLIEKDRKVLRQHREKDLLGLNHMVDISLAPLSDVDFSPFPGSASNRFVGVGFNGSNFARASFEKCTLENVWFSTAYFEKTNFRGSILKRAEFDGAYLLGVDFRGATFENCNFKGAVYDKETKWPDEFNPEEAGAILYTPKPEVTQ